LFYVLRITKHTNLTILTKNSNWVWHCTLPHNWLPVPHSPTLHHFIVSWSYDATNDVQYLQPTPIWPGSSIHWAMVINTCVFWKVMGSIPNLVRAYLCPYHFGCSAKVWIECCQWDFGICPLHGNGSRFSFTWKIDDGIFMESSVSFLGKTIKNKFTYIQSQGNMQLGNAIYGTVLDPLIDYSGQTNLFATIINFERMWKSLIYTHHLQQKVFHYGLAWVL